MCHEGGESCRTLSLGPPGGQFEKKYTHWLRVSSAQVFRCLAEHDLAVGIDAVQRLDHEWKIYSKKMKGETGSGTYDLQIRGGDTKFIVPFLS